MTAPNPNDLNKVITNAKARRAIYAVYVIGILILGAFQVGFAAGDVSQPAWLNIALAVAVYLGVPVGTLAAVNTPTSELAPPHVDLLIRGAGLFLSFHREIGTTFSGNLFSHPAHITCPSRRTVPQEWQCGWVTGERSSTNIRCC